MSVNNPEGVSLDTKRQYSPPSLSYFGNLAGMTASGAGTVIENMSMGMDCPGPIMVGDMDLRYPCF